MPRGWVRGVGDGGSGCERGESLKNWRREWMTVVLAGIVQTTKHKLVNKLHSRLPTKRAFVNELKSSFWG